MYFQCLTKCAKSKLGIWSPAQPSGDNGESEKAVLRHYNIIRACKISGIKWLRVIGFPSYCLWGAYRYVPPHAIKTVYGYRLYLGKWGSQQMLATLFSAHPVLGKWVPWRLSQPSKNNAYSNDDRNPIDPIYNGEARYQGFATKCFS